MGSSDDLVEVTLLGRKIHLRAEGNEEYIRQVAQYVEERMDQAQATSQSSTLNVAILAALNIADDYFKSMGKQKETNSQVERQCIDLINYIDSVL